jgi:AcrR family transcriptional regulator
VLNTGVVPRLVDHDARRAEIADAVWRVVRREGIEGASVRRVAAEAGCSTGSLRHYFATQSELVAFAMELVVRRVTERVVALRPTGPPVRRAVAYLEVTIPLDDERRAEMQVWLAFTARALVDPALAELRDRAHADLRGLCAGVVRALGVTRDVPAEAERLHALVDGLALHAVVDPRTTTPRRVRTLLRRHLEALAAG